MRTNIILDSEEKNQLKEDISRTLKTRGIDHRITSNEILDIFEKNGIKII